jgi:ribosomal protein S25
MYNIINNYHINNICQTNIIKTLDQVKYWNKLNWPLYMHQQFWKHIEIIKPDNFNMFNIEFIWNGPKDINNNPLFLFDNQYYFVKSILFQQYYYIESHNLYILNDIFNYTDPQQLIPFQVYHSYLEYIVKLIFKYKDINWIGIKKNDIDLFNRLKWDIKTIRRFFNKINIPQDYINDHWMWMAGKSNNYGQFSNIYGGQISHRLIYELIFGKILNTNVVRHIGDIEKSSVNIFHLILGEVKDNNNDKVLNGNSCFGEKNPKSKLSELSVIKIEEDIFNKQFNTIYELSQKYNISKPTIMDIIHYKTWKYVTDDFAKNKNMCTKELLEIFSINTYEKYKIMWTNNSLGEANPNSVLTKENVYNIITQIYEKKFITIQKLSEEYNVNPNTICMIISYKNWANITNDFAKNKNISVQELLDIFNKNILENSFKRRSFVMSGENCHTSKLTNYNVIFIYLLYIVCNVTHKQIYNYIISKKIVKVSLSSISHAINGTTWKPLQCYRDAIDEMKIKGLLPTLSLELLNIIDINNLFITLLNFMNSDSKYQNSYYLDILNKKFEDNE